MTLDTGATERVRSKDDRFSKHLILWLENGGAKRDRTADLLHAI